MGNQCSLDTERCGFQCTAYDGSHKWAILHDTVASIECDTCRQHAMDLMSGLHDHVNSGLGEKIYDKVNYAKFVDEVNCVFEACKREGRC